MFSFLILDLALHGSLLSVADTYALLMVAIQLVRLVVTRCNRQWLHFLPTQALSHNPCTSFTNTDESVSLVGWQGLLPILSPDPALVLIWTTKYNVKFTEGDTEEKCPRYLVCNNGELDLVADVTSYYIYINNQSYCWWTDLLVNHVVASVLTWNCFISSMNIFSLCVDCWDG